MEDASVPAPITTKPPFSDASAPGSTGPPLSPEECAPTIEAFDAVLAEARSCVSVDECTEFFTIGESCPFVAVDQEGVQAVLDEFESASAAGCPPFGGVSQCDGPNPHVACTDGACLYLYY